MFICCIGDSITLGYGDSFRQGWVGRLFMSLDPSGSEITGYNLGIRAASTVKISKSWKSEADTRMPFDENSKFIFSFGTADVAQGVNPADTLKAAREILEEASALCKTFFVCPPPVLDGSKNEKLSVLCAEFKKICGELNIPCVDLFTEMKDSEIFHSDLKQGDGVHPDKNGYQAMADKISEVLAIKSYL